MPNENKANIWNVTHTAPLESMSVTPCSVHLLGMICNIQTAEEWQLLLKATAEGWQYLSKANEGGIGTTAFLAALFTQKCCGSPRQDWFPSSDL